MYTLTQARRRFAEAKSRIAQARAIVRREDGGIDLPSTMVSILVIAAFLAAAALAVFVVIPWAQNNAAKQLVSQVATAQSASYAVSADGTGDPQYSSLAALKSQSFLAQDVSTSKVNVKTWNVDSTTTTPVVTGTVVGGVASWVPTKTNSDAFAVSVRSDTGTIFTATNENPQPK